VAAEDSPVDMQMRSTTIAKQKLNGHCVHSYVVRALIRVVDEESNCWAGVKAAAAKP
jgi:hypothetical protein